MNLKNYYQKRAKEYELVYEKPERQADLRFLKTYLSLLFEDKYVREIACGTGYWTQVISETAEVVYATDINEAVLKIAKAKVYLNPTVFFKQQDLWAYGTESGELDAVFGGFIWSHILKADLPRFLMMLERLIERTGSLVFIDNKYVEGSSTPISRTNDDGNTYQIRKLQNGKKYEVLKNFPTKEEIEALIENMNLEMKWMELEYYWVLELRKSL